MDEFIFTQFSCAKYGVLDLLIEYTKKIDVRINGGYIYNITIVNSANGNKAHMEQEQKIILHRKTIMRTEAESQAIELSK